MGQKKNLLISSAKSNFYFINPTELYCTNFLIEVTFWVQRLFQKALQQLHQEEEHL